MLSMVFGSSLRLFTKEKNILHERKRIWGNGLSKECCEGEPNEEVRVFLSGNYSVRTYQCL